MSRINRKYVIETFSATEQDRVRYMVEHMRSNKAFIFNKQNNGKDNELLEELREKYISYRRNWREIPKKAIENKLSHSFYNTLKTPPLCVDIEIASFCDLACPFCYRQHIVTPDKFMEESLVYTVIDQSVKMDVPSIKMNWRGESLSHPKLPEFIRYAKRKGILEVILNTNATMLDERRSRALIDSGLDTLIYSFDGASAQTYEKMRVGRFKDNRFEDVVANIRRFAKIRYEKKTCLPVTKIQMILTEETYHEKERFYKLFKDSVDIVSTKAYSERGGRLHDLGERTMTKIETYLDNHPEYHNLKKEEIEFWRDQKGKIYFSFERLPCDQIFQRLLVSYDGRVSMCCYDWENNYVVGLVCDRAIKNGNKDYVTVLNKANKGSKGYEKMRNISMTERCETIPKEIKTLKQIWDSPTLNNIREKHVTGRVNTVQVCKNCNNKETFKWNRID
ncbi:MAG: radical SAM/SPASM domain-containing protein [Candidatus Scalinduaceae bacterium]